MLLTAFVAAYTLAAAYICFTRLPRLTGAGRIVTFLLCLACPIVLLGATGAWLFRR
ncbi:hypothetical protein [Paraburkholderia kururiensis]|uniref:hypothetical protein n=1 Tax=Paraburkholderia kururiensis TaxID=984307 RepID=UPI00034D2554|nr:hypothetical protein [Paraburkholderia kururiensis]